MKPFCKFDGSEEHLYQIKGGPVDPYVEINGTNCDLYMHLKCGQITPIPRGSLNG